MRTLFVGILSIGLLAGCSSQPSKPAAPEKPQPKAPEAITGSSAMYKCYIAARGWAADAQPFRIESELTPDSKGRDGKAVTWRAGFASAARRTTRLFTWSDGEITPNVEDTYSPTNSSTQVFNIQFLQKDSDAAFEVAQKHGGDKVLESAPDTPIFYRLEWNPPTNGLVWHVTYGTDSDSAKLRVAVDASTGEFVRVER